jgi:hypothetical protein
LETVNRKEDQSEKVSIFQRVHKYGLLETFIIITVFFIGAYTFNPHDVCLLNSNIPYLLIILAVITLFHGFESGVLAIGMIAFVMWFFYPVFQYVDFLILFMMTLIFSQFHYYWTTRIREAELTSEYKNIKLNELSKAFYTLKISHDQLEKNYVTKPMSLRDSLISIRELHDSEEGRYSAFLTLLEKSFSVEVASISMLNKDEESQTFERITATEDMENEDDDFEDLLVKEVLELNRPAYISNGHINESKYIAVIPVIKKDAVLALLLIKTMPFMSFNRENLTSIAILFEYFYNEFIKEELIVEYGNYLTVLEDREFKFELYRLYELYNLYKVDSTIFVLKFKNEIFALKVYEIINNILRSLDMVTYIEQNNAFYVTLLFPFADESTSYGFLERLKGHMELLQEEEYYEHFNFSLSKLELFDDLVSGKNELF